MILLRKLIENATKQLATTDISSPRINAELLAAHAASVERWKLIRLHKLGYLFYEFYLELINARTQKIPLQYLIGTAPFGQLSLLVGPSVFIPRPETESILAWIQLQKFLETPIIIDLCSGSGALALALSKSKLDAFILAVENSFNAIDYAKRNIANSKVEIIVADVTIFELMPELDEQVNLLVSNPPYLPEKVILNNEEVKYDPPDALFGGFNGTKIIDSIIVLAERWLAKSGVLVVEYDEKFSQILFDSIRNNENFFKVKIHFDLNKRARFITAVRTGKNNFL